jgi:hypothetical protein
MRSASHWSLGELAAGVVPAVPAAADSLVRGTPGGASILAILQLHQRVAVLICVTTKGQQCAGIPLQQYPT